MISIEVARLDQTGTQCANPDCKHLEEYFNCMFGHVYHIKTGSICAFLSMPIGSASWSNRTYEVYCTDCIDTLYQICKTKLNKALWAFH